MTQAEHDVIGAACVLVEMWGEMMATRRGRATKADAKAMLQLIHAVERLERERDGAAR